MNKPKREDGTAYSFTSIDPNADYTYKQKKSLYSKKNGEPLIIKE